MTSYIIVEVDPTYKSEFVIAVYDNEEMAYKARTEASERMIDEAIFRGVFYRVTAFQTNKLYH
jgi:hypothetical protein